MKNSEMYGRIIVIQEGVRRSVENERSRKLSNEYVLG
jgi:hypothetical protein